MPFMKKHVPHYTYIVHISNTYKMFLSNNKLCATLYLIKIQSSINSVYKLINQRKKNPEISKLINVIKIIYNYFKKEKTFRDLQSSKIKENHPYLFSFNIIEKKISSFSPL